MDIKNIQNNMGSGKTTIDGVKENYKFILAVAFVAVALSIVTVNFTTTLASVILIPIICVVSILLCMIRVGITVYNGDSRINTPSQNKVVSFIVKDNKSGKVAHILKADYFEAIGKLRESKPFARNMDFKKSKSKAKYTILLHVKGMGQYKYDIYNRFGLDFITDETSGVYRPNRNFKKYILNQLSKQ